MNDTKMSLPSGLLDGIAPKGDLFYAEEGRTDRKRCAGWPQRRKKKIDIAGTINKSNIYTV